MRGMASVLVRVCPPSGRYPMNITAATPGFTNTKVVGGQQRGGDSQIELGLEVAEGEFAGYPAFDNLGTDGGTPFGSVSKKRLRQLDVQGLDSDAEIPDDVIAQQLLGRRVWAEVEREQQMSKGEDGKLSPRFEIDEKTGSKIPVFRLKIIGYLRQATAQTAPQQGQQHAPQAPQGYAPPPQGYAPPTGYAPPQQGFVPPPQGGYAPPQGYAPPAPGAVPGGYAPPAPVGGFPQVAPPPGWTAPPNGAPAPGPGMQAPGAPQQGLPFPGAPR